LIEDAEVEEQEGEDEVVEEEDLQTGNCVVPLILICVAACGIDFNK
tara:strand:+ start:414 stop:551 length:138 start_codon:yes stop_codon:yes gene_type:complete